MAEQSTQREPASAEGVTPPSGLHCDDEIALVLRGQDITDIWNVIQGAREHHEETAGGTSHAPTLAGLWRIVAACDRVTGAIDRELARLEAYADNPTVESVQAMADRVDELLAGEDPLPPWEVTPPAFVGRGEWTWRSPDGASTLGTWPEVEAACVAAAGPAYAGGRFEEMSPDKSGKLTRADYADIRSGKARLCVVAPELVRVPEGDDPYLRAWGKGKAWQIPGDWAVLPPRRMADTLGQRGYHGARTLPTGPDGALEWWCLKSEGNDSKSSNSSESWPPWGEGEGPSVCWRGDAPGEVELDGVRYVRAPQSDTPAGAPAFDVAQWHAAYPEREAARLAKLADETHLAPDIVTMPGRCGGRPTLVGSRLTTEAPWAFWEDGIKAGLTPGAALGQALEAYPHDDEGGIRTAIAFEAGRRHGIAHHDSSPSNVSEASTLSAEDARLGIGALTDEWDTHHDSYTGEPLPGHEDEGSAIGRCIAHLEAIAKGAQPQRAKRCKGCDRLDGTRRALEGQKAMIRDAWEAMLGAGHGGRHLTIAGAIKALRERADMWEKRHVEAVEALREALGLARQSSIAEMASQIVAGAERLRERAETAERERDVYQETLEQETAQRRKVRDALIAAGTETADMATWDHVSAVRRLVSMRDQAIERERKAKADAAAARLRRRGGVDR